MTAPPRLPSPPTTTASQRPGTWAAAAAMGLFLAWLLFPLAYGILQHTAGINSSGAPQSTGRPSMRGTSLSDRLKEFSEYYERTNSIRPLLIPRYMGFKLYTLGMSSVAAVVAGSDHWLFVGRETDKIDERRYFLGTNLFPQKTLAEWLRVLGERQRWLERRGIAYLLVVAPNKSSIYPEHMPAIYPRNRKTRLDQLEEYLQRRAPDFPLLDLRPALRAGKKERLIYWPADSHWNDFGRYLAYREIVHRLSDRFPSLEAIPEDAFAVVPCLELKHDLRDLLLLPWNSRGPFYRMVPKRPLPAIQVRKPDSAASAWERYHANAASLPLAIVIHDSFGESLRPLIGSHFRRSHWILDRSHAFPSERIERTRPCLVIEEIAERYLDEDPWSNPAGIRR